MTQPPIMWACWHCDGWTWPVESTMGRTVLEVHHLPGCPDYIDEDEQEAAEYVVPLDDPAAA